jgi:hypothetical protein
VDNSDLDLLCPQLLQRMFYRFDAALDVGLENNIKFFNFTGVNLVVKGVKVDCL